MYNYSYLMVQRIRRLAWALRKDDTHKSRSVNIHYMLHAEL